MIEVKPVIALVHFIIVPKKPFIWKEKVQMNHVIRLIAVFIRIICLARCHSVGIILIIVGFKVNIYRVKPIIFSLIRQIIGSMVNIIEVN